MPTQYTKYRIWLNRCDTHERIVNENIWVGNVPNDGRSKVTSGMTYGPNYAYVEFDTWEDLLIAIGVDPEKIDVTLDGTLVQEGGESGDVYLEIDGTLVQDDSGLPVDIDLYGTIIQHEGETPVTHTLEVELVPSGNVPYTGGNKTLRITSDTTWEIIPQVSWLSITGGSTGQDTSTRGVTVQARSSGDTVRSGNIVISGGGLTRTVTVYQDKYEEPVTPSIEPWDEDVAVLQSIACDDTTYHTVRIASTVAWRAATSDTWITVTERTGDFQVKANSSNTGSEPRTATITVWSENTSYEIRFDIEFKQLACSSPEPIEFEITGELTQE